MTTYTIALAKGGSTKTTTAAELAHALAARGRRVLAIDLEQQGNLSSRLGVTGDTEVTAGAAEVLLNPRIKVQDAAIEAPSVPGVQVLVGTDALEGAAQQAAIVSVLRARIPTWGEWDDVVIDTPPAMGNLTLGALAAADVIVAPVPCEPESWEQLGRLERYITEVVQIMREDAHVAWVLPTKHNARRRLDRELIEALAEQYPGRVTPPVREATIVRESYLEGQPVSVYAPRAAVSEDYARALDAILDPAPEGDSR